MRLIIIFVFLALMTSACEEVVDRPVTDSGEALLVVSAVFSNQSTQHKVTLTWTTQQQNGNSAPVSGALVTVNGGGVTYIATETSAGSGEYLTPKVRFESGTVFTMEIRHQGKIYLAQDSAVPVELLEPVNYTKSGDEYRLILSNSGVGAHYVTHDIDWSSTTACNAGETCRGKVTFYDLKTIDVNEITKPPKENFTFPVGSTMIRTKYSVSAAYRKFLRSILSETEWRGSAFDVDRGNAPTNFTGGAIGFFAVTSVVSDTTLIVAKP